jgi:hypothetical protein
MFISRNMKIFILIIVGGGADVTVGPGNPGRPVFPGGEWR